MATKSIQEDFKLGIRLIDCQGRLIRPSNTNSFVAYLYTDEQDIKVNASDCNDVAYSTILCSEDFTQCWTPNNILKYTIYCGFNADGYADGERTVVFSGDTNIYITK